MDVGVYLNHMTQKVFILLLTILVLGGLVFYMYTISLEFEDSVFTQLKNTGPISPSAITPVSLPPPAALAPPPPVATSIQSTPILPLAPMPLSSPTPLPTFPVSPPISPVPAKPASLSLLPSSVSGKVGDEFKVDVFVDTAGQNAVAVLASISFDKNTLVAERVDVLGSVFPIEAERGLYSGSVRIVRGARSPGYSGPRGLLGSIYFRAQAKGSGVITLEFAGPERGPSRIILDGEEGKDILKNAIGARYTVL